MDHYVANAHHMIMIAKPLSRVASMYYYEAGYTKQKGRFKCATMNGTQQANLHDLPRPCKGHHHARYLVFHTFFLQRYKLNALWCLMASYM